MPDRLFGLPTWGVIAAIGAAGVIGYFIFFRNQGSSSTGQLVQGFSGTTNPDVSAAYGTLQNQLIDLQNAAAGQAEISREGFSGLAAGQGQIESGVNSLYGSNVQQTTLLNGLGSQLNTIGGQQAA